MLDEGRIQSQEKGVRGVRSKEGYEKNLFIPQCCLPSSLLRFLNAPICGDREVGIGFYISRHICVIVSP